MTQGEAHMKATRERFTQAVVAGLVPFSRVLVANDAVWMAVAGIGSTVKIGVQGKQSIQGGPRKFRTE